MPYRPPIRDIRFALREIAGLDEDIERGLFGDLSSDLVDAVLDEAGKFAAEEIDPLNKIGDEQGSVLENGKVRLPDGWGEVYTAWTQAGWGGLPGPEKFGGQNLPNSIAMAVDEMWNAASVSFSLCPLLTQGSVEAIHLHGSKQLQDTYLEKLVSGEWTGTMNLTEPQAGTDLGLIRTKAEPSDDGSYKITGTKIFITYGDHEMTENIIHLVLARLPDAPDGTRGISMFVVPKYLVNDDGSIGARNDVICSKLEHKLGIHASPTCVLNFGEENGASGWIVGEPHRGLKYMFTMMNRARLAVGIQGVAIAERAFQQARDYALERKQGQVIGGTQTCAIIEHPDVRRNLLTMKSMVAAARAICLQTAAAIDIAERSNDKAEKAAANGRAGLLTPIAKAFSTDIGVEAASLGIQVHGGMGFIEETGAAQYLRDARILPIYEGTNGVQALDLIARKLPMEGGKIAEDYIAGLSDIAGQVQAQNEPSFGTMGEQLTRAIGALGEASLWLGKQLAEDPNAALAGATPYLRLFGLTAGGALLAKGALASTRSDSVNAKDQIALARYFAENHLSETNALKHQVMDGATSLLDISAEALSA